MADFQPGMKTEHGYLAVPESGSGPGVLVLHAWWGLNAFFQSVCDRLAREGFVALAPDLYGGAVAATIEQAEQLVKTADFPAMQGKAVAALEALRQQPAVQGDRISTIGFSLGAAFAFALSGHFPEAIGKTVVFYGLGEADFAAARCAYLCHFAEEDAWEPLDQAQQMAADMRKAGREVAFYAYPGVGHWFFEDDRPDAYDAESARLAWERTLAFLKAAA